MNKNLSTKKIAEIKKAREWAVQILFQLDLNPDFVSNPKDIFKEFWNGELRIGGEDERVPPSEAERSRTEAFVRGVMRNIDVINDILQKKATNWDISRIGAVERSILRLGIYEIKSKMTHVAIVVNESLELCRFFNVGKSCAFVNGILDAIDKDSDNIEMK